MDGVIRIYLITIYVSVFYFVEKLSSVVGQKRKWYYFKMSHASLMFQICLFLCYFQVKIVFNKSVSWVRVRDDHILTVDQITFIADERFHAYHATENGQSNAQSSMSSSNQRRQLNGATSTTTAQKSNSDSNSSAPWTLQIKYVQARDAGIYECQISAEPKISARVYLHVVGK